ncbi:MAG: hypothetical protein KDK70_28710, partial [Myxococcales bacterium]|nr:hypothetical protein [Myxococcales bacterium]
FEWVRGTEPAFFALFGTEFVLRLFVVVGRQRDPDLDAGGIVERPSANPRSGRSRGGAIFLLVVDLVALVSFLPLGPDGARWLRLFRLTRMLLLVSYWSPMVIDLWSILSRRERARQIIVMGFVVGGLSFTGAVIMSYLADPAGEGMQVDVTGDEVVDAEDRRFLNLLWWAFRQVQDPGNMLESPIAIPLVLISLGLTVFGLFLVSFLIGLGTDVVHELLMLSRLRPAGLRGHTVIVGNTPSTPRLLAELMRYYRKLLPTDARVLSAAWFRDLWRRGLFGPRFLVVGRQEEPPDFLRQPELSRIVYRERADQDDTLLVRADLAHAKRIVLLADPDAPSPDADTIQSLLNLVERVRFQVERRPRRPQERQRVVIAEILDDSNIAAARAAVLTGRATFRAFVVPSERLVALFIAGVVRRPGLGTLLEELLTSRGHELYTCFFQTDGLGFTMDHPPELGRDPARAIDRMLRQGLDRQGSTVVPVGLLVPPRVGEPHLDFEVVVNPRPGDPVVERRGSSLGFVAIADNFRTIREFAEALPPEPSDALDGAPLAVPRPPEFERTAQTTIGRVLVCGFRRGSIYMLEELLREQSRGEVLVLVEDEAAERRARDAIEEHSQLVDRSLMPAHHGTFTPQPDGSYVFDCKGTVMIEESRVHIAVGDWMASRHLVDLPAGFGHVGDLEAVVFVAELDGRADARTTTALLKLEGLLVAHGAPHGKPRVVAEVFDARLAARLEEHFRTVGKHHVRIYSIPQLRAFFLFQSVVVPGFDSVYSELLGSWGQSFVRLRPTRRGAGRMSFRELALGLRMQGQVLVAVRLRSEDGPDALCVAPGPEEEGYEFDREHLRYVWVISTDSQPPVEAAAS